MAAVQDNSVSGVQDGGDHDTGETGGTARSPFGELIFVLILAALDVSVLVQVWRLPFYQPDGTIGPGFFPVSLAILLLAILLGFTLYLAATALRARETVSGRPAWSFPFTREQIVLAVLIGFSVLAGSTIGLIAVVGVVLLAGLLIVERVPFLAALTFTIGTLVSVYLIFDLWLGMNVGLRALF